MDNILTITCFLAYAYVLLQNDLISSWGIAQYAANLKFGEKKSGIIIWLVASCVTIGVLYYGWSTQGNLGFGRLVSFPKTLDLYWWHIIPCIVVWFCSRKGIPVGNSFLIAAIFGVGEVVFSGAIIKTIIGYVFGFILAMVIWGITFYFSTPKPSDENELLSLKWTLILIGCSIASFTAWILNDAINFAVVLPRTMNGYDFILVSIAIVALLYFVICYCHGGMMQDRNIHDKSRLHSPRTAALVQLCFAAVLFGSVMASSIPMSSSFAFIGILQGRETIASLFRRSEKYKLFKGRVIKKHRQFYLSVLKKDWRDMFVYALPLNVVVAYIILLIRDHY